MRHERLPEEIDSYLYQTVGQDAIESIAQALDVPLYRKTIDGTAVEQGSEYGGRTPNASGGVRGDETEDLFDLLSTVMVRDLIAYAVPHLKIPQACHPDIRGVSVGAILSSYQRVRVEHVSVASDAPTNPLLIHFKLSTAWSYGPGIPVAKGTG